MRSTTIRLIVAGSALVTIAGCGGATTAASNPGGGSSTTQTPGASTTIAAAMAGGHGLVLVAGFNGMTLYQFDKDVAGSSTSACIGGCITTWPPLTVPAGTAPTAAAGITGRLGTLTRSDGKGVQVTYNGLPLHFYSGDTKAGDANGNYPHWASVSATSGGAAAAPTPTAAAATSYGY